jgi:signal transduction histidine kinase/PAS domain-containing protein
MLPLYFVRRTRRIASVSVETAMSERREEREQDAVAPAPATAAAAPSRPFASAPQDTADSVLSERAAELEAIQSVMDVALAHLSLDRLMPELLDRIRAVLGADNAAVLLASDDQRELTIYLARGPEEEVAGQVHVPIGHGVAGRIAATRQPLIVDDLTKVEVANPFLKERLRSLVGVPLLVEDRLLGVLHAAKAASHHFTQRDVRLLQLVGDRIALAIDHARLYEAAEAARRAAQALNARLEAILESMVEAIFVYDGEGGIARTNAAARELFAMDVEPDYVSRPLRERVPRVETRDARGQPLPEDQWPQRRVLRGEVLAGDSATDYQLRVLDGREVTVNVSGAPVRDAAGQVIGGVLILRDVTEQRRLERRTQEALDALLAMARSLVEPHVPVEADEERVPEPGGGVAQRLALLTCDVLGCKRVGIQAIEPETRLLRTVAVVGLTLEQERQLRAEQEQVSVHYGERADPEQLARFEAGEAVVVDMTQPPYNQLPNPYGITNTLVAPMRAGSELVGVLSLDYRGERHEFTQGELALAEAVAQLAALVIERERMLREREEARAKELALLTVNQRMDEFLGMAAHDLKSPVASGKVTAQVAARRISRVVSALGSEQGQTTAAFAEVQRTLETVARSMDRLARLVDRLLDVSRVRTGKLELRPAPCDLAAIVRQCVEEQRVLAPGRSIRLNLRETREVPVVADADRIAQVATNYLTNALRYSPEDRPVQVQLGVADGWARVAVRDEGPGIPEAERETIWARFERAPGVRQLTGKDTGLGLGLYISREIVERHGGQVGVESEPGKGSTFWFTLPLASSAV